MPQVKLSALKRKISFGNSAFILLEINGDSPNSSKLLRGEILQKLNKLLKSYYPSGRKLIPTMHWNYWDLELWTLECGLLLFDS